jgi:hypothetical protein
MTPTENFSDTMVKRLDRYMVDSVAYTVNDVQVAKDLQNI